MFGILRKTFWLNSLIIIKYSYEDSRERQLRRICLYWEIPVEQHSDKVSSNVVLGGGEGVDGDKFFWKLYWIAYFSHLECLHLVPQILTQKPIRWEQGFQRRGDFRRVAGSQGWVCGQSHNRRTCGEELHTFGQWQKCIHQWAQKIKES